jgi:hypothetical protein
LQFFCGDTISLVLGILYLVVIAKLILIFGINPRRWRMRLEFDQTGVKLVPSIFMRQLGDPSITVPLDASTKEILICRGSQDTHSPYDSRQYRKGFRVLVRSSDSKDRELKVETGYQLSARQTKSLIEGIVVSTGLPVRLIQRVNVSGAMREISWVPGDRP